MLNILKRRDISDKLNLTKVNPNKIRQSLDFPEEYFLEPNTNEIRP